jgi:hypothetical protein
VCKEREWLCEPFRICQFALAIEDVFMYEEAEVNCGVLEYDFV